MAEQSKIEWTDSTVVDRAATGRTLGAYKSAAAKCGIPVEAWLDHREAGRRHCFRCRQWKATSLFSVDRSRKGGRTASCKECTSDASTASRYGLTIDALLAFRSAHDHRCDICRKDTGLIVIDHDHSTGKPRGLLCQGCNSAIGLLGEDPVLFASALAYLEHHRG